MGGGGRCVSQEDSGVGKIVINAVPCASGKTHRIHRDNLFYHQFYRVSLIGTREEL